MPRSTLRYATEPGGGPGRRGTGTSPPATFALESLPIRAELDEVAGAPGGEARLRMRLSGPELIRGRVDATSLRVPEG
jgi:hypothetical protein